MRAGLSIGEFAPHPAVTSLRQLLRPDAEQLEVDLRTVPARTVAAISDTVDLDDVMGWYADAMAELDVTVAGRQRLGPPGGWPIFRLSPNLDGCSVTLLAL